MEPVRSSYEDDPDMLDIVREFADELPERAARIEGLLKSGELEELRSLAHQLKGAGGGYGFAVITESAASLEQALKQGADAETLEQRAAALCATLRAVEVPRDA